MYEIEKFLTLSKKLHNFIYLQYTGKIVYNDVRGIRKKLVVLTNNHNNQNVKKKKLQQNSKVCTV